MRKGNWPSLSRLQISKSLMMVGGSKLQDKETLVEMNTLSLKHLIIFPREKRGNQQDMRWLAKMGVSRLESMAIFKKNEIKSRAVEEAVRRKQPETECYFQYS